MILHTTEFRWIPVVQKDLWNYNQLQWTLATVEYHKIITPIKNSSIEYQLDELIKGGIDAAKGYRRGQSVI